MSASFHDLFDTYRHAWLAAALIGVSCSVVGVYVVLRRVAFVGIATAQVAAAGVSLALLAHLDPLPVAAAATLLGAAFFALGREPVRVSRDGVVGAVFAAASALSVLFVFRSSAELDRIEHIVYGTLLFTTGSQVQVLAAGALVVLALHASFGREFLLVSYDPETARTLGVRAGAFNLLLFATIGAVIAMSIGAAGSLLAFALLVLPPMTALLLTDRLGAVFALSLCAGVVAAGVGVFASIAFDVPTSPAIVVTAVVLLIAAFAARIRPALGAVVLAGALGAGVFAARPQPPVAAPGTEEAAPHVDLELALHDRAVRRGETLVVDYVLRVRGEVPPELHLLIDVGSALASAPIRAGRRAGRVEVDTSGLEPGAYTVSASLWTGPPLAPTVETEMLPPDVCSAQELSVEVRP